jgi:SAM-dependent methyltransferase
MKNIEYKTKNIKDFFSSDRNEWNLFYVSERKVINKAFEGIDNIKNTQILDIGCACGGLGIALRDKFSIKNYTGVEINKDAANYAKTNNPKFQILIGDFLQITKKIDNNYFDFVFSLSCIDWQNNFIKSLYQSWLKVKPGGSFIASFRIVNSKTINDISKSYQYINYEGKNIGEIAPYVVFNTSDLIGYINELNFSEVNAYGYYGKVSKTAVCPYSQVCFAVFSIKKNDIKEKTNIKLNLELPIEIKNKITLAMKKNAK